MSRRRIWWGLYAFGAAFTLCALGWISLEVGELEVRERVAREEQRRAEATRLALWRMDSWFGPQLSVEVARLPREYQAYTPQSEAYTTLLNQIAPGEVLLPSPLLTFQSEVIQVHFEVDERERWSSPQVPESNSLDLAEATGCVLPATLELDRGSLGSLASKTSYAELVARLGGAESNLERLAEGGGVVPDGAEPLVRSNVKEQTLRTQVVQQAQLSVQSKGKSTAWMAAAPQPTPGGDLRSSPLVPLWLAGPDGALLCYGRRVSGSGENVVQGFLADWPRLREALLALVGDLLPNADLVPLLDPSEPLDGQGRTLASIPARLETGPLPPLRSSGASPAATALVVGWCVALLALGAVGFSLRSSIRYGEQRSRFASTVTHELRTPLTTFRLYSEMLARGQVPEERRGEYLATLEKESDRLTTLVENVLAYSRLEQGRADLRRERGRVEVLLERLRPSLESRAAEVGVTLDVRCQGVEGVEVDTDPEAVGRILFNLVDNACKYGRAGQRIELLADVTGRVLRLRVRDHGDGVPAEARRTLFQAFDRGGLDPANPNPGVGLGLALSRGLARDLGGDLVLEPETGVAGASFCLSLPRAS